jgi:hypothetical protein
LPERVEPQTRRVLEVIHVVNLFDYFTRLAAGAGLLDHQIAHAGKTGEALGAPPPVSHRS